VSGGKESGEWRVESAEKGRRHKEKTLWAEAHPTEPKSSKNGTGHSDIGHPDIFNFQKKPIYHIVKKRIFFY